MTCTRLLVALFLVYAQVISDAMCDVTECPDLCSCYDDENLIGTIHEENGDMLVIDCSNQGLTALPDLSVVTSGKIHKYMLNMNQLTDIPDNAFAGHSIHYLTLADNPINIIGDQAFGGQERLEFLSLSRTRLQKLPSFEELSLLRTLDLNSIPITEVTEVDFKGLESLEELVLSNILLTEIHEEALSSLHTLENLKLEGCDLTFIPVAVQKAPSLINLHLDFNQISTLGADQHPMNALRTLTLSGNMLNSDSLTETTFLGIPHLHKLDLSFNMLGEMPVDALPHLASLTVLRIPDNGITSIPDGAFHSQANLEELSLAGNQVVLTPENMAGLENSLEELNLARTNLNEDTVPLAALQKLHHLKHLDLSGNKMARTHNDMFTGLPEMEVISLMRAGLVNMAEFTFRGLQKPLHLLDLNQNALQNISFIHDPAMFEKIELVGNPIHCSCAALWLKYDTPITIVGLCKTPEEEATTEISEFLIENECDPSVMSLAPIIPDAMEEDDYEATLDHQNPEAEVAGAEEASTLIDNGVVLDEESDTTDGDELNAEVAETDPVEPSIDASDEVLVTESDKVITDSETGGAVPDADAEEVATDANTEVVSEIEVADIAEESDTEVIPGTEAEDMAGTDGVVSGAGAEEGATQSDAGVLPGTGAEEATESDTEVVPRTSTEEEATESDTEVVPRTSTEEEATESDTEVVPGTGTEEEATESDTEVFPRTSTEEEATESDTEVVPRTSTEEEATESDTEIVPGIGLEGVVSEAVTDDAVSETDTESVASEVETHQEGETDAIATEGDADEESATDEYYGMTEVEEEVIVPIVNVPLYQENKEKEEDMEDGDDEEDHEDEWDDDDEEVIKHEEEDAKEMGLGLTLTANSQIELASGNQTAPETEAAVEEPPRSGKESDVKAAVNEGNSEREAGEGAAHEERGERPSGGSRGEPEANQYTDSATGLFSSHLALLVSIVTVSFFTVI